jgi:hypothetical protein
MTASMVQFDLAARVCPPLAAATIFAALMALTNLASSLGEWLGGTWYESLIGESGGAHAFAMIVGLGVTLKASCWLIFVFRPSRWNLH